METLRSIRQWLKEDAYSPYGYTFLVFVALVSTILIAIGFYFVTKQDDRVLGYLVFVLLIAASALTGYLMRAAVDAYRRWSRRQNKIN